LACNLPEVEVIDRWMLNFPHFDAITSQQEPAKDCRMFFISHSNQNSIQLCHVLIIVHFFSCCLSPSAVLAEKLSAIRSKVREEVEHEKTQEERSEKLSTVKHRVREAESDSDHDDHHRSHDHHSNRGYQFHPEISFQFNQDHIWVPRAEDQQTAHPLPENPVFSPAHLEPIPPSQYFSYFPYANGWDGYMVNERFTPSHRTWAARFRLEYGNDFDDVDRWSAGFFLEESEGWGIESNWSEYTENLGFGDFDQLRVGDFNVFHRLVETSHAQWRMGLGFNWLSDPVATDYGINFTLGMDLFPKRPWVISSEIDWGTIGDAKMFHGKISVGATWDRVELFGGYDYRLIGSIPLQGPMFGVRIWF
jgi:hypothetical protein